MSATAQGPCRPTPRASALMLLAAKMRVAAKRNNTPVHQAADKHLGAMQLAVMYGFLRGRKAYKAGGVDAAVKAIHAALLVSLPPVLVKTFVAGGNAGAGIVPKRRVAETSGAGCHDAGVREADRSRTASRPITTLAPFDIRFDVSSPEAIAWAKEHAAELADGLSETSRDNIKDAIASALEGDGIDAAYDDILAAVGDSDRAEMIARTEVMTAANEGQREGWSQAVDAGLLPKDTEIEWIATSDCCDDCADLDGATRPIDGEYEDSDAGDGPPLHPNCRCTEGVA
jgi:hypothetical protein